MKMHSLALAVSLSLAAASAPAAVFTDWTSFDPFTDVAAGTLGGTSVTLSGGDIDVAITDGTFPGFSFPLFTPPLPASDMVSCVFGAFATPSGDPTHTVTFGGPVTDPVIHIFGLASTLTFNTVSLVSLSGSFGFTVAGNQVQGGLFSPEDFGSVQLSGTFTSFSFSGVPASIFDGIFIQIGGTVSATPCITCPSDVTVNADAGKCTASGVALGLPTLGGTCVGATVANNAPAVFPKGATTVIWTATDGFGNTTTCQQTVTVVDNEPPTISCPPAVTASAGSGCTASGVALGSPTTSDNCGVASVVNNAPASFPKGVTTVTWTVTDTSGNTATCQQTVTVTDTTPPTIACPASVTVSTDPNLCTANGVALGSPLTADNCGIASVVNNAPSVFGKGTTTVTWTVTDISGNTAYCQQTVTVVDGQNPTIACPPNIVANTAPGQCSAAVTPGTASATDNCPGVSVAGIRSDAQALNAAYPKGVTTITWTATDVVGNTASCQQTVTVEDHEAPQFTCPPNVAVESVPPPPVTTATDNCDPNPTVTAVDVTTGFCPVVITRTYTVTDNSGNITTCQQLITVGQLFAADAVIWHQPLARNGGSEDTDPSAGGSLKYRFKLGSTIPVQIHAQGCGGDVTANANVTGKVEVFGDSNCDGVADSNALPIDYNGVGGSGGAMDKIGGHLKYNLDTKTLPTTTRCYILKVTVTDTSTGQEKSETVLLQAK
jgi:hypothetical protein